MFYGRHVYMHMYQKNMTVLQAKMNAGLNFSIPITTFFKQIY